ncbi:uncharacterized protein RAG0_10869 [Rhynchosporium agropyri]|uniref:Heterokaryon incompatibility domain-containing protein n=1 Tax=Rhynchosporium agropyri TaxID=914238 RepID=A0A1E1L1L7_9HELO|nr:uncharacterized protein RAG0_10869 [Rhynchosporium agropyri]
MSFEDIYGDYTISEENGSFSCPPLPTFSFPELPPDFTTENDKKNWKILGDILNKCSEQVSTLDNLVKELVSVNKRFRFISDSVKWLKLELERMCEMPPLAFIDDVSQIDKGNDILYPDEPIQDVLAQDPSYSNDLDERVDDRSETAGSISHSDSVSAPKSVYDRKYAHVAESNFQPSETYDWSEIEDDILLLQEVIIMNPLMAVYEILDDKPISEEDLDKLFAQSPLVNWDGTNENTLLEVLKSLTASYVEWHRSRPADPSRVENSTGIGKEDKYNCESLHTYPSPRMTDAHEIRILELLPGSEEDPVCCQLSIEHLFDDPRYKALSYAWGSATDMKTIQLNEINFEITPNLESALRHLRDEVEPRRLWVDALCINQADPVEKQVQVGLMSQIYPAAEQVLCWLGPEADDSDFVIKRLQHLADTPEREESDLDSNVLSEAEQNDEERLVRGLFLLKSRQWWSRLWTCQEYALTLKDPLIICGKQSIPWSIFHHVARGKAMIPTTSIFPVGRSGGTGIKSSDFWDICEAVYRFDVACKLRTKQGFVGVERGASYHPIYTMAIQTQRHRCTDPRDKVYGILSFLSGPYRTLFPPNYTQPIDLVALKYSASVLMLSKSGRIYNQLPTGNCTIIPMIKGNPDCASTGRETQCIAVGPRLLIRGVILELINTVTSISGDRDLNAAQAYTSLSEFRSAATTKAAEELDSTNFISRFQHLRTSDSVQEVTTYRLYNQDTFQWTPMISAKIQPTTVSHSYSARYGEWESESGFFGIGGDSIREGDLVAILFGFDTPMILRPQGSYFSLFGPAVVGGIMHGQLMEFVDDETSARQSIPVALLPHNLKPRHQFRATNDTTPPAQAPTMDLSSNNTGGIKISFVLTHLYNFTIFISHSSSYSAIAFRRSPSSLACYCLTSPPPQYSML